MRARSGTVASIALLAGVAVPLMAAPAQAAEYRMDTPIFGGFVEFVAKGDKVRVCDTIMDDAYVRLQVFNVTKDPNQHEYTIKSAPQDSTNECFAVNASMGQPWNLAEKHCFHLRIWLVKDGKYVDGSENNEWWRNYNNDGAKNCSGVN
ncbi:hypothetical protein [Spirillospora sp. NPDC029432]|uniref:hypothetical protein n=1 Tax=Spirillospora sp. NPDC029432 TaxID=3154599 RepID=UPI003453E70E